MVHFRFMIDKTYYVKYVTMQLSMSFKIRKFSKVMLQRVLR
jgi:hypothetical protein